jgi:hypothetical protein
MSQIFRKGNEFRAETETRTLPTIDAKPESENRQSICRRPPKKQDPPHGQKTYRLAQTKPIVSTQSGCGPSAILFPRHFRIAPKLRRRAPNRQIHTLPPFSKNSCSTIRPSSAPKNESAPLPRSRRSATRIADAVVHPKHERIADAGVVRRNPEVSQPPYQSLSALKCLSRCEGKGTRPLLRPPRSPMHERRKSVWCFLAAGRNSSERALRFIAVQQIAKTKLTPDAQLGQLCERK